MKRRDRATVKFRHRSNYRIIIIKKHKKKQYTYRKRITSRVYYYNV